MHKRNQLETQNWFQYLLTKKTKKSFLFNGYNIQTKKGYFVLKSNVSKNQDQTKKVFGFKWNKTDTYNEGINKNLSSWLKKKYKKEYFEKILKKESVILDAGCGSALSARLLFGAKLKNVNYVGVDISNAIEIAKIELEKIKIKNILFKCDLNNIPIENQTIDLIFSEGVLHHLDNPFEGLSNIVKLLKKKGIIMFYVYKKKAPIREFSDKLIRQKLKKLSPKQSWDLLLPLTKLGNQLGKLDEKINIKDDIELLEIPKGKISIQRLFYWYIFKIYYNKNVSLKEMQHINFDWYSPINASTHTKLEVEGWCKKLNLKILNITVDNAGITVIAKK